MSPPALVLSDFVVNGEPKTVAYEGYNLVTRTGLRRSEWRFIDGRDQLTNMLFLTITAGLR